MRYSSTQVVFQEIPNEISLAIHVTGCPLRCLGCHSSDSWSSKKGNELSVHWLLKIIEKYRKHITCVLYLGGEWHAKELVAHLTFIKSLNLSGQINVPRSAARSTNVLGAEFFYGETSLNSMKVIRAIIDKNGLPEALRTRVNRG
jgi:anaerobic ribonucleoside-triphosphate reductase activating protein